MIKFSIHSIVDVITNSSTVIYTYQDSVSEAKALVQAVLDLTGEKDATPDDVFYYGVFCDNDTYLESESLPDDFPPFNWVKCETEEDRKAQRKRRAIQNELERKWLSDIQTAVMKGGEKPQWMRDAENRGDYDECDSGRVLCLVPKDDKYQALANTMKKLLGSVHAEANYDG